MKYPLLREIIRVMKEVADAKLPLYMPDYFEPLPENLNTGDVKPENIKDIHSCGRAACVIGYASLDKKVCELVGCKGYDRIEAKLFMEFGIRGLRTSIIGPTSRSRLLFLDSVSNVDIRETLLAGGFNHLHSDEPTAEDAVEYMEAVLDALETFKV